MISVIKNGSPHYLDMLTHFDSYDSRTLVYRSVCRALTPHNTWFTPFQLIFTCHGPQIPHIPDIKMCDPF